MEWWQILITVCGGLITISGAIGVIKKPWKSAKVAMRETVVEVFDEKIKGFSKEIDYLHRDYDRRMLYAIINFAQDLRNGQHKTWAQFAYIIEVCDEYIDSGKNGQGKANANFVMQEYEKHLNKGGEFEE